MARSNFLTKKPLELYSDVPMNFDKNPLSNNLAMVTNEQSIKQSLKCLLSTNLGDRLYDSTVGSDIYRQLFEPNDDIAINNIMFAIRNTINFNEPRVTIISLAVVLTPDNENFNITLTVSLVNDTAPITVSMLLRRVR